MDDLIQRARNGDGEAFAALFEYGKQPLWRAAMAVLGNVDDASDALQETAVKAWRAMPRFGGRSAVNTWFMRILLRVCYDMRRQRNRETPCAMGLFAADVDGSGVWWEPSADQMLAGAGVRRDPDRDEALDVRDAIASLSADAGAVLRERFPCATDLPDHERVGRCRAHPSVAGAGPVQGCLFARLERGS